ncbi:transmembrane protein, putative [Medicago truncatula]|uniref:Transmembrane protein, putative n=1 Tax=Medicago truncatula TaxID=3880 RepID=A0A072U072_MEDTR|nr:transmembrane protein, putative [Medicago truncatula]
MPKNSDCCWGASRCISVRGGASGGIGVVVLLSLVMFKVQVVRGDAEVTMAENASQYNQNPEITQRPAQEKTKTLNSMALEICLLLSHQNKTKT